MNEEIKNPAQEAEQETDQETGETPAAEETV